MTNFATKANGLLKLGRKIAGTSIVAGFAAAESICLARSTGNRRCHLRSDHQQARRCDVPKWRLCRRLDASAGFYFAIRSESAATIFWSMNGAGKPPLLVFKYETIVDGRKCERPVNYALVRITPPAGTVPLMKQNGRSSSSIRALGTDQESAGSNKTPKSASR